MVDFPPFFQERQFLLLPVCFQVHLAAAEKESILIGDSLPNSFLIV